MENCSWLVALLLAATVLTVHSGKIKDPRIINGDVAEEGQFPWQVVVVSINSSVASYCGGAIISDSWILTAAHCINKVSEVIIIYDTLEIEGTNYKETISNNFVVHENYDPDTLNNDIGLVYLDVPLELEGNVAAIALAEDELKPDTVVTVSGWGTTSDSEDGYDLDVLRYISVTTMENDKCIELYGSTIVNDGVFCTSAGTPVKNPCLGDGGDPVVVDGDSGPVHVGIFSFLSSLGCENTDYPAGYTRTAYYREWIKDLTGV